MKTHKAKTKSFWACDGDGQGYFGRSEEHNNTLEGHRLLCPLVLNSLHMFAGLCYHLPENESGVWVLRVFLSLFFFFLGGDSHSCPTSSSVSKSQLGHTLQEFWQTFWKAHSDQILRGENSPLKKNSCLLCQLRKRLVNRTQRSKKRNQREGLSCENIVIVGPRWHPECWYHLDCPFIIVARSQDDYTW